MRYPLVDGQGNFGSVDDDPAAAMRYTEARLAPHRDARCCATSTRTPSTSCPTTTATSREPLVLPARFPNLLVNGSSGIAVGMATNIPPHNLREMIAATIAYIDDPDIDTAGPDAAHQGPGLPDRRHHPRPSAASATPTRPAAAACACARSAHIEEHRQGKEAIIVTELPYMVKKGGDGGLIQKIADLVHEKKITEISDIARRVRPPRHAARDRAQARRDPEGRAQQALQAHADADDVRREHGRARRQRAAHAVAARGHPPLRPAPARGHRPAHEARAAHARGAASHILEGLLIALDNLDAVIELIRALARPRRRARTGLIERFEPDARSRRRRSSTCACRS